VWSAGRVGVGLSASIWADSVGIASVSEVFEFMALKDHGEFGNPKRRRSS
jgi:hypothetical protein